MRALDSSLLDICSLWKLIPVLCVWCRAPDLFRLSEDGGDVSLVSQLFGGQRRVISGFLILARVFIPTCLVYCDALSPGRTQSSLNHAHFICLRASKQRLLPRPRSVQVGDCAHGTFHQDLKTLQALCERTNLQSPECLLPFYFRMIYGTQQSGY